MRVAITGASGFIGTHLVTALGARGHTAVPVKREAAGELVSPHEGERAEALVHLAFPTDAGARRADPVATLQAVVRGAAKAVAIAEQLGASHLVLASTGKVFGSPDRLPIADDDHAQPTTQLGLLKRLAEEIFACAARRSEVGVTSLRIFNAYGPGQTGAFLIPAIPDGIARGELNLGELEHARDWIHVTDVAHAFTSALEVPAPRAHVRTWNVGSGEAHSARQILALLRIAGAAVPAPRVDPQKLRAREAVEERARCDGLRALGWLPRMPLDQGLSELLGSSRLPARVSPPVGRAFDGSPAVTPGR